MEKLVLFLLMSLALFSCKKDDDYKPSKNAISFASPAIGQISRYQGYVGEGAFTDEIGVTYMKDTLVIEIVGKDENGWILENYYTPSSEVFLRPVDSVYAAEVEQFYLSIGDDSIRIFVKDGGNYYTRLFAGISKLPIAGGNTKFVQNDWKLVPNINECPSSGKVKDYNHLNIDFGELTVAKNGCMSGADGPDYIYAYSMKAGLVHFEQLSIWQNKGFGWNLIH